MKFSELQYGDVFEFCKTKMIKIKDIGSYSNRAVILNSGEVYHLSPDTLVEKEKTNECKITN